MSDKHVYIIQNVDDKRKIMSHIGALKGPHKIHIQSCRPTRSLSQQAYYWGVHIPMFTAWITENWGQATSGLDAHEILKQKYLRKTIIDPNTGEAFDTVRSTTQLSTLEFTQFLEHVEEFLADYCGLVVPPAGVYESAQAEENRSSYAKSENRSSV